MAKFLAKKGDKKQVLGQMEIQKKNHKLTETKIRTLLSKSLAILDGVLKVEKCDSKSTDE